MTFLTAWDKMLHRVIISDYIYENLKTRSRINANPPTKFKYALHVNNTKLSRKPDPTLRGTGMIQMKQLYVTF